MALKLSEANMKYPYAVCAAKLTGFAGEKAKQFRLSFAWDLPEAKGAKPKP